MVYSDEQVSKLVELRDKIREIQNEAAGRNLFGLSHALFLATHVKTGAHGTNPHRVLPAKCPQCLSKKTVAIRPDDAGYQCAVCGYSGDGWSPFPHDKLKEVA